jgi:large subunit ribosomal protein L25
MSVFTVQRRSRTSDKPKQLRRSGMLPMALIERSHETTLLQANTEALRKAIRQSDGLGRIELQIEGEKGSRKAIVKHVESDPLKHELIHVTLQEVSEDDSIKVDIPVVAIGEPKAMETDELILTHVTDHLKVKGKMSSLPERIEVDVTNLEAGGHINASDIQLPEGIELISSPESTLFSLRHPATVTESVPAEGEEQSAEEAQAEAESAAG